MRSGLVVLSEPKDMCYPYIESIKSIRPVVDELVVAWNPLVDDGSREELEKLGVRLVSAAFDLDEYGWISYAIARTTGYQACKGDTVLMFDADGILHEKQVEKLKARLDHFEKVATDHPYAYWTKYRFYKPTIYHDQYKHSGIYSKKILGDRFDFYRGRKGAPNTKRIKPHETSKQFDIQLYGYEHLWDTKEVLYKKIIRYGKMIDRHYNKPYKADSQYIEDYLKNLKEKLEKKGQVMAINLQPAIIQPKLKSITEDHFGYAFFE